MKVGWMNDFRRFVIACMLFASFVGVANAQFASIPEDKENFLIFLLMGQSNMEGGSSIDGEMDEEANPRVLKLGTSGWQVATDPITNNCDVAVGPSLAFAKRLVELNPDITVGLIPLAEGGTQIEYWSKPGLKYNECVQAAVVAREWGTLGGILWHQGEHDSYTDEDAYGYEERLRTLIDDLRLDAGDVYLPFISGGLTDSELEFRRAWRRVIVGGALKTVAADTINCGFVSAIGVDYVPLNEIHFSSDGQRVMGEGYADEYLRVAGFWTDKAKDTFDEEATTVEGQEDGWKYHPSVGVYYDEKYPIIKHAQLGWLKLWVGADGIVHFNSPFLGDYRFEVDDGTDDGIYIRTEDLSDVEFPIYGPYLYVNMLAYPGDQDTFYDHSVESYLDRLPGMIVFEDVWDFNESVESTFTLVQTATQNLWNEIALDVPSWSAMRKYVDLLGENREYTVCLGWEGYHFAEENETGDLLDFWKQHFYDIMTTRVDPYVLQAQTDFQNATDVLLQQND